METMSGAVDYLFPSKTETTLQPTSRSQVQIQDASTCPFKCEAVLGHNLNSPLQIINPAMAIMVSRPEVLKKAGCAEMYSAVFSSPSSYGRSGAQ